MGESGVQPGQHELLGRQAGLSKAHLIATDESPHDTQYKLLIAIQNVLTACQAVSKHRPHTRLRHVSVSVCSDRNYVRNAYEYPTPKHIIAVKYVPTSPQPLAHRKLHLISPLQNAQMLSTQIILPHHLTTATMQAITRAKVKHVLTFTLVYQLVSTL